MLCQRPMLLTRLISCVGACALACLSAAYAQAQPEPPAPLPAPPPPPALPALPAGVTTPASPQPASTEPAVSDPETLETPYPEAPPQSPATPSVAPPVSPPPIASLPPAADTRPRPIRAQRKLALLGEVGWNGLAGFGVILTYYPEPHVGLDLAGGFSLLGWKGGIRARYNFLTDDFTPFLGVGFNAASGFGQVTSDPKKEDSKDPNDQPFTIEVRPSYLLQTVVGFDVIRRGGFTMQAALGYAALLNHDNVQVIDGPIHGPDGRPELTHEERIAVDVIFKGGPVVSFAFGSAFD